MIPLPAMIEAWKRVLVLAPHTDDGEFGCGGTMVSARLRTPFGAFNGSLLPAKVKMAMPMMAAKHAINAILLKLPAKSRQRISSFIGGNVTASTVLVPFR